MLVINKGHILKGGNMAHHRKKTNSDDPQPLNFDKDEEKGPQPVMTPDEERGDNKDDQDYEEEEALSPEEVQLRKEEGEL